ncbi:MAG TPA: hypothetical protein VFM46_18405, partial [Pseudomonadales bacterium]|nr:hypothetical protein [Pseudomonadales bacterium]
NPHMNEGVPQSPKFVNGGQIILSSDGEKSAETGIYKGNLILGDKVSLSADGGAYLSSKGKLAYGKGGSISLSSTGHKQSDYDDVAGFSVGKELTLSAFSGKQGGKLSITASSINLLDQENDLASLQNNRVLGVGKGLFSEHGFESIALTAWNGDLIVSGKNLNGEKNNTFSAVEKNYVLADGYAGVATGADIHGLAQGTRLRDDQRRPMQLEMSVKDLGDNLSNKGKLLLEEGATLKVDAGGSIALNNTSGGQLLVDGNIVAPAGNINLYSREAGSATSAEFDPSVMTVVSSKALLDASSAYIKQPNTQGLETGKLLDAGTVQVSSGGYVIMEDGAKVKLNGIAQSQDFTNTWVPGTSSANSTKTLYSDAGELVISAGEGAVILAEIDAHAAAPSAHAGKLTLKSGDPRTLYDLDTRPNGTRTVVIKSTDPVLPSPFSPDTPLPVAAYNGLVFFSSRRIENAGFDDVSLTGDRITLENDVDLSLRGNLILNSADIHVASVAGKEKQNPSLTAHYIALKGITSTFSKPESADQSLTLNADWIDLADAVSISGINKLQLNAEKDVRVLNTSVQGEGALISAGDIVINAAQLEAASNTHFTIAALDYPAGDETAHGDITIKSNGHAAADVLSAQSSLTLAAHDVQISGSVKAPFGEINVVAESVDWDTENNKFTFDANSKGSLSIDAGAVLDTSLDGVVVPFGNLDSGDWYYGTSTNRETVFSQGESSLSRQNIHLTGDKVNVAKDATLNLSGGGDLLAYQFIAGSGGSKDVLDQANTWAILPGKQITYAPYDAVESNQANQTQVSAGTQIYLAGGNGVEAGYYTLLPAHYALLPGAKMVRLVSGYKGLMPGAGYQEFDGTPVQLGYFSQSGTPIQDGTYSAFEIRGGEQIRQLSEYAEVNANAYLSEKAQDFDKFLPTIPNDAGVLSISADSSLSIQANLQKAAAKNGRLAELDLSAPVLSIVDRKSADDALGLQIAASDLKKLGFDLLVLGAESEDDKSGRSVTATADQLNVLSGVDISASEVILGAKQNLQLGENASITSTAPAAGSQTIKLKNDASYILASGKRIASVSRENPDATHQAILHAGDHSRINAAGGIVVDTSGVVNGFEGSISSAKSVYLGAENIALGGEKSDSSWTLNGSQLAELGQSDLLTLRTTHLDIQEALDVNAKNMVLDVGALNGNLNAADSVRFTADSFTLQNSSGAASGSAAPAAENTRLTINAGQLILGKGHYEVDGFDQINLNGSGDMILDGHSESNWNSHSLSIQTPRISAAANTNNKLNALGDISIAGGDGKLARSSVAGGAWHVNGENINFDTTISMPSGLLELDAKQNLSLGDNANVDLAGASFAFG